MCIYLLAYLVRTFFFKDWDIASSYLINDIVLLDNKWSYRAKKDVPIGIEIEILNTGNRLTKQYFQISIKVIEMTYLLTRQ